MTDAASRLQGILAGRYVLERELGTGGMATVYLARDEMKDRPVAIKVLHPELAASLGGDRFIREIDLAGKLHHPNIMGIYDSGEADGLLYYVMPYVQGESLRDRLERERQLPVELTITITRQVADALTHAHQEGVVHRDIKPENILLEHASGNAIVADFGVAHAVSAAGGEKLTKTGMAVGTPIYMSPEQAAGVRDIAPSSDQYSLACVVYEMLIGQPPFTGPTPMAIMARHSLEEVPSLRIVRAAIPDEVEEAVHRALEKTPADRYTSVADFATALTTPSTGKRARSRPSRRDRTSRGGREPASLLRRPWVMALGVAGLALVGGGTWGYRHYRGGGAAPEAGPDPRHVAVLYFEAGSGEGTNHLADGLTEALIHELSGVKVLQVISRNGVAPYRGTAVAPDSISRALHVGTLVEGTVAQAGDSVRVDVSMVNPTTGAEVGSTRLTRPRSQVLDLQDDLAKEVSIFLRKRLGEEVQVRAERAGTGDAEAWELFQQAQATADGADTLRATGDGKAADRELVRADSLLAVVEQKDDKWVRPIVLRGWLVYRRWRLADAAGTTLTPEPFPAGMAHAEQALKLAPQDPDALELRGTLRYWGWLVNIAKAAEADRLLADAERDLRAAVQASPTQAGAWSMLSSLLLTDGRTAEGKLAAQRAYEADPYLQSANLVLWRLASSSVDLEDPVEAAKWCREGLTRFPTDPRFQECQIWQMALKGQTPDIAHAWQLAEQYEKLSPPDLRPYRHLRGRMIVALALARAGLADSAKAVAAASEGDPTVDSARELLYFHALVHILLGEKDAAFRLLARFLASNPQQRASMAKDDSWWLRDLRNDPRFKQLVDTRA